VVQHSQAPDEVEVAVGKRQRLGVTDRERAVRRRVRAGGGEILLRRVDTDDLADERRERVGERPRPAADVERTLVTAQRCKQTADACLEVGVALRLERAAALHLVDHASTVLVVRSG
jgi:hypothetical protein